jgi:hypothetical protein
VPHIVSKAARDYGFFGTIFLYNRKQPKHERRLTMSAIKWEKEFHKVVELAGKTHKPIFQDFWFDG